MGRQRSCTNLWRRFPPDPAKMGKASGYISGRFAIGSSDFFSFSDDDFVYTDPEAYSPLTRLAAGPATSICSADPPFLRAPASQQFWSRSLPPSGDSHNLGSLEIRVSTYISAKLKKLTYMYDSLQFPVEMNTRGSKTDNFYSFSHEV